MKNNKINQIEGINNILTPINIVLIIGVFSTLFLRLFFLNRTFIISDEAWYVCLLRDCPNFGITRFHILFQQIFNDNIYLIRFTNYILNILGNVVFSYGLYIFIKNKFQSFSINYFIILGAVFLGQQKIIASPSINYITLNLLVSQISVGFLFLALVYERKLFFFISGCIIGLLFPVMITNVIVIGFITLFIIFNISKPTKYILSFFLGVLLFFVIYLTFLDTPRDFFKFLYDGTKNTLESGAEDYSIRFIIRWTINTVSFLLKQFIYASIIYFIYNRFFKKLSKSAYTTILVMALLLYVVAFYVFDRTSLVLDKILNCTFIILLFITMLDNKIYKNKGLVLLSIFIFSIMFSLCIGSNIAFVWRMESYMCFMLPLFFIIDCKRDIWHYSFLTLALIALFNFWNVWGDKYTNWYGNNYMKQTVPVSNIGINQNIRLNENYISKLVFAKQILGDTDSVINDSESWGIVTLLNLKPLSYTFRLKDNEFIELVTENLKEKDSVYVILNPITQDKLKDRIALFKPFNTKIYTDPNDYFTVIKISK